MTLINGLQSPFAIVANGEIKNLVQIRTTLHSYKTVIAADGGTNHCIAMKIKPAIAVGDFDSTSAESMAYLKDKQVKLISAAKDKDETDLELAIKAAVDLGAKRVDVYGALGKRWDHAVYNVLLLTRSSMAIKFKTETETIFSITDSALQNLTLKNISSFSFNSSPKIPLKASNNEVSAESRVVCVETRVMNSQSSSLESQFSTSLGDSYSVQSIFDLLHHLKKNPSATVETPNEKIFMIPVGKATKYSTNVGQIISFLPLGPLKGLYTEGLRWELTSDTFATFFMSMSNRSEKNEIEITLEKGHLLCCWNK
jgi:thiamine pyrophosphokinase